MNLPDTNFWLGLSLSKHEFHFQTRMAGRHTFVTTDRGFTQFDGLDLVILSKA